MEKPVVERVEEFIKLLQVSHNQFDHHVIITPQQNSVDIRSTIKLASEEKEVTTNVMFNGAEVSKWQAWHVDRLNRILQGAKKSG